ncbi:perlucin-like protein [Saccostrea cucullata]|uniref:perlucin-like protein n=1 Tax=Saccostrea cuccullata TaxID=36930 RepID=UPI002ED32B24
MCQGDRECCFYGFNPQMKKCRTHKKIFTSGVLNEVDWRYYAHECCPSGWRRYQDHCYLFEQTFLIWSEQRLFEALYNHLPNIQTYCTNNGAYLVEIDTKEEDDWLVEQISMRNGGKNENQYLGATSHEQLGVWRWSTDNALISYSNFWPGQPNTHTVERCIVLDWYATYGTYKWGDTRCEMTRKFICEKDL